MYNYRFNSMSTIVQISIDYELFANDMMPIYKLFDLVDRTCSRFRHDSELSQLNQQVGQEVKTSSEMFSILLESDRYYQETEGIFNPSILSALENEGYSTSIESIRGREIETPAGNSTLSLLEQPFFLNEEQQAVTLYSTIDLGGIAKGWVIDRAAQLLERMGAGFINVGGDIRIFGVLPRPLHIGIENPFDTTNMISSIQVENGAVATSTSMKRRWRVDGKWRHHLIDTKTGRPSESGVVSATITAPTALEADVWAKTVLLLGESNGQEWLRKKGLHGVIVNQDNIVWKGGA